MTQNVSGTFVSEKISKIRWRPDQYENSQSFVTGSWDNDVNTIKLWNSVTNEEDDVYPYELKTYFTKGDVTELKFINQDLLISSTSDGSVSLLRVAHREYETVDIKEQVIWDKIHKFKNNEPSSCTGLSIYEDDIVSIGEDGSINLLTSKRETLVRTFEHADNSSLQCVSFLKYNEVLTGNLRGEMKIWDLRKNDDKPANTFTLNGSGTQYFATSLTYHPTQQHIVVAGDNKGSLTVWDLRLNTLPCTLLNAHSAAITEIQFHPNHSDHLFSCSNSGELWHWIPIYESRHTKLLTLETDSVNPWLSSESIKNKFTVFNLMPKLHKPVNSIDLERNKLICGCDNEALYLVNSINFN